MHLLLGRCGRSVLLLLLAAFCVPARADLARTRWDHTNAAGVYARRDGDYVRIGNAYLERVFRISGQTLRTVALVNKRSKREPDYREGAEFVVQLKGRQEGEYAAPSFRLSDISVADGHDESVTVKFQLDALASPGLKCEEVVETYAGRPFQRKWLELSWNGDGDVIAARIDVEVFRLGWWLIGNPTHKGYGQPVFAGDMYLGLEYPGAETSASFVRYYPGRSLRGGLRSKSAIWGVAKDPTAVPESFIRDYVSTFAKAAKPFVIYNLLSTGQPREQRVIRSMQTISEEARRSNFHIDSFAIDDLWQDESTVWQPSPELFPGGFAPVAAAARAIGTRIGLWMALSGFTLDTRYGAREGLEVTVPGDRSNSGRYCIAGPWYAAQLKKALASYIRDDHVNYFKFDYNQFGCDNPAHGHPTGRAGKDAQIDAFIDILKYVKEQSPDTFVAITSGMWCSPWWLQYADAVWLGGSDMGQAEVPSLASHGSAITYRDAVLHQDLVEKQYPFPAANIMTHGFWVLKGTYFPEFRDDAMMTVGRGISDWEILDDPAQLDRKRYDFLGRVIRWGKKNWDILSNTRMILGDPLKAEVYGYSHTGKGAALIFLRNPGLQSKRLQLTLDAVGATAARTAATANPRAATPKLYELYPQFSELEWDMEKHGEFPVEILGAGVKCVAVVWDERELERLKF